MTVDGNIHVSYQLSACRVSAISEQRLALRKHSAVSYQRTAISATPMLPEQLKVCGHATPNSLCP
ncbi:MAG: hypothetical protein F6K37_08470 [Moorea sp. SIO4E2]|uniref:hypothetical protein n=1 Tax=Moorena sp. SIO4E2 TaxID=2607826 RepID=UPI0013B783CD|nr:hypothetical protein [Moorena sp. SIO4E2]NEQ05980.1 hypothetical protein [Moorena sp. SIO4E2]